MSASGAQLTCSLGNGRVEVGRGVARRGKIKERKESPKTRITKRSRSRESMFFAKWACIEDGLFKNTQQGVPSLGDAKGCSGKF